MNCRAELVSKILAIHIGRGLTIESDMVEPSRPKLVSRNNRTTELN